MNLVIVTGLLKYPLETGGDVVTFHLIKELSQKCNLTVMYPAYKNVERDRKEMQELLPGVELIIFNHDKKHYSFSEKVRNKLKGYGTQIREKLLATFSKEEHFKESIQQEIFYGTDYSYILEVLEQKRREGKVDLVQVEYPWMMGMVDYIPKEIPTVYTVIELTFNMFTEKAATFADPAVRGLWLRKQVYVKQKEIELGAKYNAIFNISLFDQVVWEKALPGHNIVYTPSGIDTEFYKSRGRHQVFDKVLLVGHGRHHANVDGVDWFFAKIYPVLKSLKPDVKVVLTGTYSQEIMDRQPKDSNITWTGFVDDLRDQMDGSISIAPIRIGSGLRIKILESLSYACPVVTTEIAREGIPTTDGYDILVRNEPEEFAKAIAELLNNQELAHRLSENARDTIVKNFELKNVATLRDGAFRKVIEQHKQKRK